MPMTYAQLVAAVTDYTQNTFDTTAINTMIKQAEQRIYNTVQIANLRKNVTGVLSTGNKYLACPEDFLSVYSLAIYPFNTTTATGTSGAKSIVVTSTTGVAVGQQVTGTNIGTNAIVRSISGTTIYLTVANSGTVSTTVTFQGDYLYLLNKDVNFVREAYPLSAVVSEPKHYAIFGPQSANVNELSFILGPTPNANYYAELHYYYYPESICTTTTTWLGDNFDSALLYGTLCEAGVYMKSAPEDGMYKLYQERYVQAIALLKNLGDGKQRADAYRDGQIRVPVA
tara:strand:+ start:1886 stop:2737 length:852 start_codon:yes stop_codon:yes gene_type:complete